MPHKRAKSSIRSDERKQKGSDLAPSSIGFETSISKRAAWVLGAEQVRRDFHERKKRQRDDGGERPGSGTPSKKRKKSTSNSEQSDKLPHKILPGESLGHFNRRIEADFRPGVRAAVKSSSAIAANKKAQKSITEEASAPESSKQQALTKTSSSVATPTRGKNPKGKDVERKTEFDTLPIRTSLHDVAMAPPTLTRATKKAPPRSTHGTIVSTLSMAQKAALELEREKAIKIYRQLKEAKREESSTREGSNKLKRKKGEINEDRIGEYRLYEK